MGSTERVSEYVSMTDLLTEVARFAHEINRAYCIAIGDNSQPAWEDAPQWQKDSALNGVIYHMDNPNSSPEDSHNNWLAEKKAAGWSWGPIKDSEKKEHPCYIEYERLPTEQKVKDHLFIAVVRNLLGQ